MVFRKTFILKLFVCKELSDFANSSGYKYHLFFRSKFYYVIPSWQSNNKENEKKNLYISENSIANTWKQVIKLEKVCCFYSLKVRREKNRRKKNSNLSLVFGTDSLIILWAKKTKQKKNNIEGNSKNDIELHASFAFPFIFFLLSFPFSYSDRTHHIQFYRSSRLLLFLSIANAMLLRWFLYIIFMVIYFSWMMCSRARMSQ